MVFQITSVSSVSSTACLGADQRKNPKIRVAGLCEENPPVTAGFPSQMASDTENTSTWYVHHDSSNTAHFVICPCDMHSTLRNIPEGWSTPTKVNNDEITYPFLNFNGW